jgi:hypothetical protein
LPPTKFCCVDTNGTTGSGCADTGSGCAATAVLTPVGFIAAGIGTGGGSGQLHLSKTFAGTGFSVHIHATLLYMSLIGSVSLDIIRLYVKIPRNNSTTYNAINPNSEKQIVIFILLIKNYTDQNLY